VTVLGGLIVVIVVAMKKGGIAAPILPTT
jgi:hypothetical protein